MARDDSVRMNVRSEGTDAITVVVVVVVTLTDVVVETLTDCGLPLLLGNTGVVMEAESDWVAEAD